MIGVILARGGSKGIKGKNLVLLNGKPLLQYTIEAALNAKSVSDIFLSSDSDEILEFGASFGINIIKRPAELADDFSTSADALAHALSSIKGLDDSSLAVLLQPTSPFRSHLHIDLAYKHLLENKFDSLISVTHCDNKLLKAFVDNADESISGVRDNILPFTPRQNLPQTFMSNGAIYIVNALLFMQGKSFMQGRCGRFVMSERESFDIDTLADLEKAQYLLGQV